MLNTVSDLAGEDFAEVAAWLENDGAPVDIRAVVMGRLASGALVTMNALRRRDPVVRFGHPRVLRARRSCGPGSGASGSSCSAPARRLRKVRSVASRTPSGSSSSTSAPGASRTRARPRSACGWPACGTRSANRRPRGGRPPVVPAGRDRAGDRGVTDPGHGLERVPPGALRPAVAAIYPDGIHAAIADGLRAGRASRSGRRPWTSRSTG